MEELAIKIEHVSKQYRLGAIGGGTLKGDLQTWWAKKRGKEDPNSKIGANQNVKMGERFLALDDINLEVKKGEALGIIGHNGAGKSTLLKLLCRVTAPTSGRISMNGRIASMLEVGTGFHPEMTGRENIYLNGAILGLTKKEIDARMEQIIDFSEVRQFIDTPVKRYSSGMYVKLAFSVAAHLDSEIMIMDEVLAVGDMAFQKKCLDKMREAAKQEGRTVLYVSHNMSTIRQLCDRCVVLDHGKVIFDGDVEEAISLYFGIGCGDDFPTYFDLSKRSRQYQFGKQIKCKSFSFIGKQRAEYTIGEPIQMEVGLTSLIAVEKLHVIVRVFDKTNTNRFAGGLSEPFCVHEGETKRISFQMDTSSFVENDYSLSIEIITKDSAGNYYSYDNPGTAFPIHVINSNVNDINWPVKYWGGIRLNNMPLIR